MTVLYFAHARRAAGLPEEKIGIDDALTTNELWDLLVLRHPNLGPLRSCSRLARGSDFLPLDARIEPNDEIAIIPPVSGG